MNNAGSTVNEEGRDAALSTLRLLSSDAEQDKSRRGVKPPGPSSREKREIYGGMLRSRKRWGAWGDCLLLYGADFKSHVSDKELPARNLGSVH